MTSASACGPLSPICPMLPDALLGAKALETKVAKEKQKGREGKQSIRCLDELELI